jgi:hypothetical protein
VHGRRVLRARHSPRVRHLLGYDALRRGMEGREWATDQ